MLRIGFPLLLMVLSASCDRHGDGRPATVGDEQRQSLSTSRSQLEPEIVLIARGAFLMGGNDSLNDPVRRMILDDYFIGQFEVTNAQYKAFCDEAGYPYPDAEWSPDGVRTKSGLSEKPDYPVVGINWEDAVAYCGWLKQKTGKPYRLPSEAEWEKAARGGLEQSRYPWGNEEFDAEGRYRANCGSDSDNNRIRKKDGFLYTAPVGSFPPNGFGIFDMAGNVWEWCSDYYETPYDSKAPDTERPSLEGGEKRSLRGGSWFGGPSHMQCAARLWNYPLIRYASTGFRVAMTK